MIRIREIDHLVLRVVDLEFAIRVGAEGSGPSIYVNDPDGNVVELKGPPGAIAG